MAEANRRQIYERKAAVSDQPKITWFDLIPDALTCLKGQISFEAMRDNVLAKARENDEKSKKVQAYIESLRLAPYPSHRHASHKSLEDLTSYGRDGVKRDIGFNR